MHNSIIYSSETMTLTQWFSMLANQSLEPKDDLDQKKDEESDVATYVYLVDADEPFIFNGESQEAGTYYTRVSKEEAAKLSVDMVTRIEKLSFSDIVALSDIYSTCLLRSGEQMDELLEKGEVSDFFEKELDVTTQGLKTMREKAWTKYFDFELGLMAIVRRVLSAIANFFGKYANFIDTGIYWPGNSCHYADKVANQIHEFKKIFISQAYAASKELVSERLDIAVDEIEKLDFDALKTLYRKKALQVHPDKNPTDPTAAEKFHKINRVWGDFFQLHRLKEKFGVQLDGDEDLSLEVEDTEPAVVKVEKKFPSEDADVSLTDHYFKVLALPAPLPVLVD